MRGRGFDRPRRGRYETPRGDKPGSGPGGDCVCPNCNYSRKHTIGVPCNIIKCPKCGSPMTKA